MCAVIDQNDKNDTFHRISQHGNGKLTIVKLAELVGLLLGHLANGRVCLRNARQGGGRVCG